MIFNKPELDNFAGLSGRAKKLKSASCSTTKLRLNTMASNLGKGGYALMKLEHNLVTSIRFKKLEFIKFIELSERMTKK